MTDQQILLQQILGQIVKNLVFGPQPIRRRDPAHARHFVHVHQRPRARESGVRVAAGTVDEHHVRDHPDIVLPAVAELVPPFAFDDFGFVDVVDGPEVGMRFVQEDGLEDVVFVRHGRFVGGGRGGRVLTELVLVVGAIEGHLDLPHVFFVAVGVVHRSVSARFVLRSWFLVLGECDLLFLLFGLGLGAEFIAVYGLKVLLEVGAVGMGDGDVVKEFGAAKNEAFFPIRGFVQEFLRIIGKDAHDQFIVLLRGGSRVLVLHAQAVAVTFLVFGIKRRGL